MRKKTETDVAIIEEAAKLGRANIADKSDSSYSIRRQIVSCELPVDDEMIEDFMESTCESCKKSYMKAFMIECTRCGKLYHKHCLDPPMNPISDEDSKGFKWICKDCIVEQYAKTHGMNKKNCKGGFQGRK
ncbi:hypothetical protein ACOME3_010050 [Neoechinorhynchus agilis]